MDELKMYLEPLYGKESERMEREILAFAKDYPPNRNPFPDILWHKILNLYVIYPDSIEDGEGSPLSRLVPYLTHIKSIGCNALHILPFFDSPLVDAGFDIRNYMKIRPDLGTMDDLKQIVDEAHKLGVRLFMDFVANHVSEEHEWFQKAQAGDEKYRRYFIYQKEKPEFVKTFQSEGELWARYIVNGREEDVYLAFPEQTGEIPHWRQGKDGYWYYHTYYPQQLDVNWHNPDVFIEFAKIIIFWVSLGFNFRIDATPFIGKGAYKKTDIATPFTAHLASAVKYLGEAINSEFVTLTETYEKVDIATMYFGTTNIKQSQLSYNFHLCTSTWVALVKEDVNFIWRALDELYQIPIHADWINFLRNHDELSLAHMQEPLRTEIQNALMKNGEPFREGYGISGTTLSLLGGNEARLINAYLLLAALPGGMLVPYGDEFGKENTPLSALPPKLRNDTRNIHRAKLGPQDFTSIKSKRIQEAISDILRKQLAAREYLNIMPQRLPSPPGVFAAAYRYGVSEIVVFTNISNKTQRVKVADPGYADYEKIFITQNYTCKGNEVTLSPYAGVVLQK